MADADNAVASQVRDLVLQELSTPAAEAPLHIPSGRRLKHVIGMGFFDGQ